jgi:uncharacterized protein
LPYPAAAQKISPALVVAPGNAVLTVSAEGKSLQQPDLAVFNAGVTTQGKPAGEALAANSRAMESVITHLRLSGPDLPMANPEVAANQAYTSAYKAARSRAEPQ